MAQRTPATVTHASTPPDPGMKSLCLVIPVFNESTLIGTSLPLILEHLARLDAVAGRVLVVDDGSGDDTVAQVQALCERHANLELLCLNRNFGKEAAIHAGLCHADSDAVVVMDSDLQHPPQLLESMVRLWLAGARVVEACKSSRGRESLSSRLLAAGFYRLFNLLAGMNLSGHSDFKLLDREVVEAYCALPERKRFFRGIVAWLGFASARVYFEVPPRPGGTSAWSRLRLLRFSLTALTGFTSAPLHLVSLLGLLCFGLSLVLGGIALYDKFNGDAVSGFTTVILLILLIGSFVMFGLGLLGMYLEQIFDEVKQRPTYLTDPRRSRLRPVPPGREPGA